MLDHLSREESEFYSLEENVIDPTTKSTDIVEALENRFSFLGGELEEYIAYFARDDIPDSMWGFLEPHVAKATAGFSAAPKKDS